VCEGGGEYNVARGLRRCFGLRSAIVSALADNPVGRLIEDLLLQGGVDLTYLRWLPFDGCGREVRNGLNFVERGFGARAAVSCSDRGHTAISQLAPGAVDWSELFGGAGQGAVWFHTGGVFSALSGNSPLVAREAMQAAEHHGTRVSFDLNYRDSLFRHYGGKPRAQAVNRTLLEHVDVVFGNEDDFAAGLGFAVSSSEARAAVRPAAAFRDLLRAAAAEYPRVHCWVLRTSRGDNGRGWAAIAYCAGEFYEAAARDVEILDRVGGGDAFASGFLYGLMTGKDPQWALECGLAHGALAMSTPGDSTQATLDEVLRAMSGAGARIER
jgi:2-dehydro-3-deoxygluconokinase